MPFDFDKITPRRGTGAYKWDAVPPAGRSEDILPLWVADMDFPTAPCIIEALRKRVDHGIFGYTQVPESYYQSIIRWFGGRHGWKIDRDWILYTSGVIPALSAVIKALVQPGEKVIVQTPVYNCFFSSIRNNGCVILDSPLRYEEGTYHFDFEDLERKCSEPDARMLLLCNPHNPAGRVWTPDELRTVGEIARRHGVIVVSDEIHCEIVMPGYRYTPYASVPGNQAGSITLCSPSKSFNTAGLQIANIITDDAQWRRKIDRAININEVCDVNPFGPIALQAAYSDEGAAWLEALNRYLQDNYNCLKARLAEGFPICKLEGTYLAWVDVRSLGIPSEQIEESLLEEEKVWINAGTMYGTEGFIRINLATPRSLLTEGISRINHGLKRLQTH
ncbi:MAG: pyridoxal phosphate-dependent aminotransferase [Bacteroidales bacterium]|nr:pyridoxal phosphate-dependent aminotransferase [Bacteroidales bacterium]